MEEIQMKRLRRKQKRIMRLHKNCQNQEPPIFERLETRLLLNADMSGLSAAPLNTDQPDDVIEADLIIQSDSATASLI